MLALTACDVDIHLDSLDGAGVDSADPASSSDAEDTLNEGSGEQTSADTSDDSDENGSVGSSVTGSETGSGDLTDAESGDDTTSSGSSGSTGSSEDSSSGSSSTEGSGESSDGADASETAVTSAVTSSDAEDDGATSGASTNSTVTGDTETSATSTTSSDTTSSTDATGSDSDDTGNDSGDEESSSESTSDSGAESQSNTGETTSGTSSDASSDASSEDDTGGDEDSSSSTGDPDDGCGLPSDALASEILVRGQTRSFELHIPSDYDPNRRYPVLFTWHGRGGSAQQAKVRFGLDAPVGADAFIVYPDGQPQPDTGTDPAWNLDPAGEDFELFDALVAYLEANACIDASRIFATGWSYGGFMSNSLGCHRASVLRGVAPVAGRAVTEFGPCQGPMAAWITHGRADSSVDFADGEATRDQWRNASSCTEDSTPVAPEPCAAFAGCSQPVHWCAHDAGHPWPDFASPAIWDFFSSL